eukprot:4230826-Amphidinium_carterae.1
MGWGDHKVRADFLQQATSTARLTEQDLPFLSMISPNLQACLREHEYAHHFMQLQTFRTSQKQNRMDSIAAAPEQ